MIIELKLLIELLQTDIKLEEGISRKWLREDEEEGEEQKRGGDNRRAKHN